MSDRVLSYEFALSARTKALIVFDGEDPDGAAFARLRDYLTITEKALLHEARPVAKRKKPELRPCSKHPNAPRSDGPRRDCLECRREHAKVMVLARKKAS